MVLGIKSSDTRRKEEKRRKYIRKERENGKRTSRFVLHQRGQKALQ
jgi:hypothetical protein